MRDIAYNSSSAEGAHTATIQHGATSTDANYNSIAAASVTVNVTDNDTPAVAISESSGDTGIAEGGASDNYTIKLTTQPIGDVTIQLTTGAQASTDVAQLIFTMVNWNTSQSVTVTAVDDALAEGPHTATILHSASSSDANYDAIVVDSITVHITDNDTPGVIITESGGSTAVTEGGATDSYAIVLASQPTGNVTVTLVSGVQATVNLTQLVFTPATWNSAQFVTATAVDDAVFEGAHTATILHSAASTDTNYDVIPVDSVTVHITDNDPSPTLSIADVTVSEGGGTATFTVTLSLASSQNVHFNYATSDGTATASSDYTAASGTLAIPAESTTTSFDVGILEDAIDENPETFTATLSSPTNATLADGSATGTITDNDSTPTISFESTTHTTDEGTSSAIITVTLSAVSGLDVTAQYATSNGTATAGNDYTSATGTVTVPAGQISAAFIVPILEDAIDENDETVNLNLSNPTVFRLGAASAILTIADNDPTPTLSIADVTVDESAGTATYTVTLSAISGLGVTVSYATNDDTASAGSDYIGTNGTASIPAGSTIVTFAVGIIDDAIDEFDETYTIILNSPVNATIADAVGAGTITDNDILSLTVNIPIGAPGSFFDFTAAGFPPNATAKISVNGVQVTTGQTDATGHLVFTLNTDGLPPGIYTVTVEVDLTAPVVATLTPNTLVYPQESATTDVNPRASVDFTLILDAPVHPLEGNGSVTNLPKAIVPEVSFDSSTYSVKEIAGNVTVIVSLNRTHTQAVTARYATADQSAIAGRDYTATSGILTIPAGEISRTLSLPIVNDRLDEDDETFSLSLSDSTNATVGTENPVILTILDSFVGIHMPNIYNNFIYAPDLVISNLAIANGNLELMIKNQGTSSVTDSFWVDAYINPSTPPIAVNQICCLDLEFGIAWGVDERALPILPGQSIRLTINDIYYSPSHSHLPSHILAGAQLYAQVDSWKRDTAFGGVQEIHEITGGAYNNIVGPVVNPTDSGPLPTGAVRDAANTEPLPLRP